MLLLYTVSNICNKMLLKYFVLTEYLSYMVFEDLKFSSWTGTIFVDIAFKIQVYSTLRDIWFSNTHV